MKTFTLLLAATVATGAPPVAAQEHIGGDRYAIVVKASPQSARRTLARIERAAQAVCGASSFSLREVQMSVRDSACWRSSVAEAVARTNDPMLAARYHRHR